MEGQTGPTTEELVVDQGSPDIPDDTVTTDSEVVSGPLTEDSTPSQPQTEAKTDVHTEVKPKSDPEERIRSFQAKSDRLQTELDRANKSYLELKSSFDLVTGELTQTKTERSSILNDAARKTQEAMDEKTELEAERDKIRAENARLKVLVANPELTNYADLLPYTSDEESLQKAVETLKVARQKDLDALSTAVRASGSTVNATPPRIDPDAKGELTAGEIRKALLAAKDPAELQQLSRELALRLGAQLK